MPELAHDWRVTCVDLPGHGRSRDVPMPESLTELSRLVMQAAPENSVWLGWSLGGLVALGAALGFPARVRALSLVSTTPRFVTAPDWPCAMTPEQLQAFTAELVQDYQGTVRRFLALQVHGDEHAQDALRSLRASFKACGEPNVQSLAAGLEILRTTDLRAELARLVLPTLIIAGGYDRVTPPAASVWLAELIRGVRLVNIPKAAHAPFVSHPQEFNAALKNFLRPFLGGRAAVPESGGERNHG